jgi:hypothetical protein
MTSETVNKKSFWPYGIVIFFLCLLALNISILITAYKHRPEKYTDKAYDLAVNFESELIKRKNFEKHNLEINYKVSCNDKCILNISFTQGVNLDFSDEMKLELINTNNKTRDQVLALKHAGNGNYTVELNDNLSGLWLLNADFKINNEEVRVSRNNVRFN